jgi:hypothetical protein
MGAERECMYRLCSMMDDEMMMYETVQAEV